MPRSKTIQSGRPVRSWEQPFRVADLFQTYLLMLVLIVIMALFIYNLGYFYGLDWRYMSLLRTRDYYSGTLPGLVLGLILYTSLIVQILDSSSGPYQKLLHKLRFWWAKYDGPADSLQQIARLKTELWNSALEQWLLRLQLAKAYGKNTYRKLSRRRGRKVSVERLQRFLAAEKGQYDKLVYKYELSRKKMWPELKVLGGIALRIGGWSLLGAAAVAAVYFLFLIPVYGKVWAAAPAYFFGGFFVTVIVLLADLALRIVHHNRSVLLLTAAVWGSFYCGMLGCRQDLQQREVRVIDDENREHYLTRAVNRGYFVRSGSEVLFIPKLKAVRLEQDL